MDFKDYYKILGVEPTADDKAIKAAYRKLARKYHPDVSKERDAEDKFKEANEAYEVLGDAQKRAEFDEIRSTAASMAGCSRRHRAGKTVAVAVASKAAISPTSSARSSVGAGVATPSVALGSSNAVQAGGGRTWSLNWQCSLKRP